MSANSWSPGSNWRFWMCVSDGAPASVRLEIASAASKDITGAAVEVTDRSETHFVVKYRGSAEVLGWLLRRGSEHDRVRPESPIFAPLLIANALADIVAPQVLAAIPDGDQLRPLAKRMSVCSLEGLWSADSWFESLSVHEKLAVMSNLCGLSLLRDHRDRSERYCVVIDTLLSRATEDWVIASARTVIASVRNGSAFPRPVRELAVELLENEAFSRALERGEGGLSRTLRGV